MKHALVIIALLLVTGTAAAQDAAQLNLTARAGARFNYTFSASAVDFTAKDSVDFVILSFSDASEIASYDCADSELTCADGSLTVAITPGSASYPSAADTYAWNLRVFEPGAGFYDAWVAGTYQLKSATAPGTTSSGGTTTITVTTGTTTTVTITSIATAQTLSDNYWQGLTAITPASGDSIPIIRDGSPYAFDWDDLPSGISNVVEDTTPQLGGTLDAQGNNIDDLGNVTFQTGASGGTLRTGTANADKVEGQAYDVNAGAYVKVMEWDAGNEPTFEVFDESFQVRDTADETKIWAFELGGITTGTTRTWTVPDADGTFVGTALTQTLTNKTIDFGGNTLTATSAQLRAALSDETGTGASVFAGGDVGAATATTPSVGDDDTSVATTAFVHNEPFAIEYHLSATTGDLETGTAVLTERMPYAVTVDSVYIFVSTAPTGAAIQVDVNEGGTTIFTTEPTIDAGEKTSLTAATPASISDNSLAAYSEITFDIDQVGSTVAGTGLAIILFCRLQ